MRLAVSALALALVGPLPALAQDGVPSARLLASEGLPAEHVALLMSDQEGGELVFEQVASVVPLDGGSGVGYWIEIDADGLLGEYIPERLFLKITVYALRGPSIAWSKSRAVEIGEPARLLEIDGVRVSGAAALEPGDYRLRVLVSEPASGRVGLRQDAITVPRFSDTAISAFALSGLEANWVDVAMDGSRPPANFVPAALAVVPGDQPLTGRVLVRGARELAIENSSSLGPHGVTADEWSFEPGPEDWQTASTTLTPAPGLSGRFELAPVAMTAGQARRETFGDVVVQQQGAVELLRGGVTELLATSQVEAATAWTRLTRNSAAAPATPVQPAQSTSGKRLAISKRQVRERLLAVLADLAAGVPGAAQRLADIESEAMGGSGGALATLGELELRTFASIQQRTPRAVLPILDLYLTRYREHLERREYFLSTHCKRVAIGLAEQAKAAGDPELTAALADFFAVVGGMQAAANDPSSVTSLHSALSMVPEHSEALAILAWQLERSGRYDELIDAVDDVSEPTPVLELRRALAGLRLDRPRALEQLGAVAEREDWVGRLASQELARAHMALGDRAAAESVVDAALTRFPADQNLILLAALLDDLAGRPSESLERVASVGAESGESARHRYARDPEEALERVRQRLTERAAGAGVTLAQVLESLT